MSNACDDNPITSREIRA